MRRYPAPGLEMRCSLPSGPVHCYSCRAEIPMPSPMQRDAKKPCCGRGSCRLQIQRERQAARPPRTTRESRKARVA
jgi:hypothetical protein